MSGLAILDGTPIRTSGWPAWPAPDPQTEATLLEAYRSGRWTITSPGRGGQAWEPRLGAAFASFCEARYAVPTANGSAALTIALAAAGVRTGDDVIVPVITWVACAASVLALGATPVPVDVSTDDLCLLPDQVRGAVTARTTAVLAVHQNCALADVEDLVALTQAQGVALIEDCSHAHGARRGGRRVGTYGLVGAFSLQQDKLLTCGEGGVAVTDDPAVFRRLQQLRANGREYAHPGGYDGDLVEVGEQAGDNLVLAEMPAAVAYARLRRLEGENARRRDAAAYLHSNLPRIDGLRPIESARADDEPTYHKYTVWVEPEAFGGVGVATLARALSAEVGLAIGVLDAPLTSNRLYRPHTSPRISGAAAAVLPAASAANAFPGGYAATQRCLTIRHYALLAERELLDDLLEGFAKLSRNAEALRKLAERSRDGGAADARR